MNRTQAESKDSASRDYLFGVFRLQADGSLFRGDAPITLPALELKALRALLAHAGRIVSPAQLRHALWEDQRSNPADLAKCIESLRARLEPYDCIESVYKRGYRFHGQVSRLDDLHLPALPRLAILPLSADFGVPEYLGMALAEETAAQLGHARHPVASIVAQDSVFTLASRGLSPREIGSMLQADLVLAGTVRAHPTHYRLEARMIRASDGSQLWMEDLLIERNRLAGLEKELADRVTFRLQKGGLSMSTEAARPELDADPLRREAWENYLQAHQEWQSLERHHMQDAFRRLTWATEIDPNLMPARVDLANLCVTQCLAGFMKPAQTAATVKRAATPNYALPVAPEAMLPMLGWVNFHIDRDLPAALRAFSHSAHLPHDPGVTLARSMFALSRHRMDEAIEILRSALRLDPWSPNLNARLIWALHLSGRAAESLAHAEETKARFPEHVTASLYGALVLASNGELARAEQLAGEKARKLPYSDLALAIHAYTLACTGREAEAKVHLEHLQWLSLERYVLPTLTVGTHVALGDHDAALRQLRAADAARCPWFFQMMVDPRLKPLHGHPEFKAMQQILPAMETAAERAAALE